MSDHDHPDPPVIHPVPLGAIEPFTLPVGETKIVEAHGHELVQLTRDGWRVVASFIGSGVIHSRHVDRPDAERRESWNRTMTIETVGPVRYLVVQRDEATSMSASAKRVEEAEAKWGKVYTEHEAAKKKIAALEATIAADAKTKAKLAARVRAMLPAHLTLERDIAALRDYVGTAKTRELLDGLDAVKVPELDDDGEEPIPF